MQAAALDITRVGSLIGAEIHGVDLARALPDGTVAAIRQALLDHPVVFFRGSYRLVRWRCGTIVAHSIGRSTTTRGSGG